MLIGKRVVDFVLVFRPTERILLGVIPLRRCQRISTKNRRFRSNAASLTQNFRWKGSPHNYSSSQNTNILSYSIKIWTDLSYILWQCTRLTDGQTDRQTDRQTDTFLVVSSHWHSMQRRNKTLCKYVQIQMFNKLAEFHGNIRSLSESIVKVFFFGGGYFFDSHCIWPVCNKGMDHTGLSATHTRSIIHTFLYSALRRRKASPPFV